ncbi:apolipoprotein D and lipocalin family protein [Luteibacter sp. Sphag1AF]|uniref:lipocalin family protein n=1 Tax=Luteibacter sp. Sphag1AF TaxID=2587031 RepID=UPI00160F0A7E|nr:lipocalin family protein [Luteibacter sp. Sphag1AF]MBB3226172.1 apolipoprotein D and lipocalin family protein [Luteibacter sp. Sphag1AF]
MRLAAAMVSLMAITVSHAGTVTAVPHVDLARYAGQWHEIARLPMYFQRQCDRNVTATYTPHADGTIGVHNACVKKDGSSIASDGVARLADPKGPSSRLQVRFAPRWLSWLPFVWADYWVIALDDHYRWAMVGQPGQKYLWILSREPSLDRATFDTLKTRAVGMGYDLTPLIISGTVE